MEKIAAFATPLPIPPVLGARARLPLRRTVCHVGRPADDTANPDKPDENHKNINNHHHNKNNQNNNANNKNHPNAYPRIFRPARALPAWRPGTLAAELAHEARRRDGSAFSHPASSSSSSDANFASVTVGGHVLFASVLQTNTDRGVTLVRPLMLLNESERLHVDLRGCSDVLLRDAVVSKTSIDERTATVLRINLAASGSDAEVRSQDDAYVDIASNALLRFLTALHEQQSNGQKDNANANGN